MTRMQELISKAPQITDEESAAMVQWQRNNQGLATAPSSLFDMQDIVRLIMYRRAIHAGMYSDQGDDSGLYFMADYPRPEQQPVATGVGHWHDAKDGTMRRCNLEHA